METRRTQKKIAWIVILIAIPLVAGVLLWSHRTKESSKESSQNPSNVAQTLPQPGTSQAKSEKRSGTVSPTTSPKQESPAPAAPLTPVAGNLPSLPVTPNAPVAAPAIAVAPSTPPAPECLTFTYRRGTKDRNPASAYQKNLLKLKHEGVNPASICVRVDRVPVAFQPVSGKTDEILVNPLSKKQNEIVVRYCLGKATCKEDCTVSKAKKDEFMEAIGAGDEDQANAKNAQWDPEEAAGNHEAEVNAVMDADMRRAMENPDERMADPNDLSKVIRDWASTSETPACQAHAQAKVKGSG